MKKTKIKHRIMFKVIGVENNSNYFDKNLYSDLHQADMNAPTPSWIKKVEVIEL